MRVLYVINGLGTGGAERSLAEMLPVLAAGGVEPSVVCLYRRGEGVEDSVRAAGFEPRYLRSSRLPGRVSELRRIITTTRPDLVHTAIFEADLVGRLACSRIPVPVLTSLVNTSYDPARLQDPNVSAGKLRAVRVVDSWTARHLTTHFHAITEAVKTAAVRDLGVAPETVTVVERGRDAARLGAPGAERRARARSQLGVHDADEVLVTAGRQEYQKGHRHFLDALGSLLRERPRLVALFAGRAGHCTSELERTRATLSAPERVRFLGHREDLPEVLAAADVFVFPSLYEGLGGAVIEAMALGLPIVASDLPALREVVRPGDNADMVPPGDSRALAAAVTSLLEDPDRLQRFGVASREIFEKRFTLEASTTRLRTLYERVAGHGVAAGLHAPDPGVAHQRSSDVRQVL